MAGTYSTGTVSVTNGSATVTVTGGTTDDWSVGDIFATADFDVPYVIGSVDSSSEVTLSAAYGGTTGAAKAYQVTRDFTTNGIPLVNRGDAQPWAVLTQAFNKVASLISGLSAAAATLAGKVLPAGGTTGQLLAKSSATDYATEWVDPPTNALDWKQSVRVASTANIDLSSGPNAGDTMDGITLAEGDPFLAMAQDTASENGVYLTPASGAPARRADFDEDAEVTAGATVFVAVGTANGGKFFVLTTAGDIVVGTTDLSFSQLSAAPEWGSIGGTLSDQTDLQAALDAKVNLDRPRALINRSSVLPVSNGSLEILTWNNSVYDDDSMWDSSGKIICPRDGLIVVGFGLRWADNNTNSRYCRLLKNGSTAPGLPTSRKQAAAGSEFSAWSAPIMVSAGDYFQAQAFQDSGGALNINNEDSTWFALRYLE